MDVLAFNGCTFWVDALIKIYSFLVKQKWLETAASKLSSEVDRKQILVHWQCLQGSQNLIRVQIEAVKICNISTLETFIKEFSLYLEKSNDDNMGYSNYALTVESTEPSSQLSYQIYVTPENIQKTTFNASEDAVFRFILQLSLQQSEAAKLLDDFCMFLHLHYLIERQDATVVDCRIGEKPNRKVIRGVATEEKLVGLKKFYDKLRLCPHIVIQLQGWENDAPWSKILGSLLENYKAQLPKNDVSYGLVNVGSCRFVRSLSSYIPQDPYMTFARSQGLEFILSKSTKIPDSNFNIVLACAKYTKDEKTSSRNPLLTILAFSGSRSYLNDRVSERKFVLDFIRKIQIDGQKVGLHFKETSQGAFGLNFNLELNPNSSSTTEIYPEDTLMILFIQSSRKIDDDFPNVQVDGTWSNNIIRWLLLRLAKISRRQSKKAIVGGEKSALQLIEGIYKSFTDIVQNSTRIRFKRSCMEITQTKTPKEFEDKINSYLHAFTNNRYIQARKMNYIGTKSNMESFEYLDQAVRFVNKSSQHGDPLSTWNPYDLGVTGVLNNAAASAKPKGSGRISTGNTSNGRRNHGGRRKGSNGGQYAASSVAVAMPRGDEHPISPKQDDEKQYGIRMGESVRGGQILPNQQQYCQDQPEKQQHQAQQRQQQPSHQQQQIYQQQLKQHQHQRHHQQPILQQTQELGQEQAQQQQLVQQHQLLFTSEQQQQQQQKKKQEQPFQEFPMIHIDDKKVERLSTALQRRHQVQEIYVQHQHLQSQQQSRMELMQQTPNPNTKSLPCSSENLWLSQGQVATATGVPPLSDFPEVSQVLSLDCDHGLNSAIYLRDMVNGGKISGSTYSLASSCSSSQISSSPDMVSSVDSNQYGFQQPISIQEQVNQTYLDTTLDISPVADDLLCPDSRGFFLTDTNPKRKHGESQESAGKKRKQEQPKSFSAGMAEQDDFQRNLQSPELFHLRDSLVEFNIDKCLLEDPIENFEQLFAA